LCRKIVSFANGEIPPAGRVPLQCRDPDSALWSSGLDRLHRQKRVCGRFLLFFFLSREDAQLRHQIIANVIHRFGDEIGQTECLQSARNSTRGSDKGVPVKGYWSGMEIESYCPFPSREGSA